jgi:hypothetical protein
MEPTFDFGTAISRMKNGRAVARGGWNAKHCIALQEPDENSANTLPYIFIMPAEGGRVPWLASQTDMLAMDWSEVA